MTTSAASPASRLLFLDWLRIAAFAILVPYHVGMYYVTWGFHVKSPFAGPGLEPWMTMSSPWRMCVLFIVSGAVTSIMLRRDAGPGFVRQRSARLLLPLLFGMLVIVPPQSYFEVVQKYAYPGSYGEFLGLYLTGSKAFCQHGRCLALPTWNHLWFLPYLWVYTVLLWSLVAVRPRWLDSLAAGFERALRGPGLVVWPIAALALTRLTLRSRFPETHALVDDWFAHALYLPMFLAGALLARRAALWPRIASWRWPGLVTAIACWAVLVTGLPGATGGPRRAFVVGSLQWGALIAAFGFAHRHLNFEHGCRRYLTDAVFPVYILHQTVIIVLSQALLPFGLRPAVEGPTLVIATFALSLLGYEAARRVGPLRPFMGLSRQRLDSRGAPAGDASRSSAAHPA
jgi:surface polysaccharide O-acyltransferase-like enzyme